MDNNKMFIFMVIFAAVMLVSIWIFKPFNKGQEQVVTTTTIQSSKLDDSSVTTVTDTTVIEGGSGQFQLISPVQTLDEDLVYENENIRIVFETADALVKHAWISDTFLSKPSYMYDVVQGVSINIGDDDTLSETEHNNSYTDGAYRITLGSWENGITLASLTGGNDRYHVQRAGDKFIFTAKIKERQSGNIYTIQKIFQFIDKANFFTLDVKITNDANQPVKFDSSGIAWSIGWGPTLGIDTRRFSKKALGRQNNYFAYYKKASFFDNDFADIKKGNKIFKQNGEKKQFAMKHKEGENLWVSASGHYFAAIMHPDNQNYNYFFDYRDKENHNSFCGLSRRSNNSQFESNLVMYIGPKIRGYINKQSTRIEEYGIDLNENKIAEIERVHMYGLGNLIGHLLKGIYKVIPNYGLTIILLTLIIKLILFPLTYKSMQSQQNMSKVQPKLKELQEKFKDKPEVLNRETMALYKKEGINPLGGCLPMVLQMPILFAMYRLLNGMVELKGAGFLWIKDLSLPDVVWSLPFTIPLANINSLNIMPILMVGVQVLSSLFMPQTSSNKQAQMMMWMMPLMFFFLFYNMPSGLVLYWTVMNILNLVQQGGMKYFKDGKWKDLLPKKA